MELDGQARGRVMDLPELGALDGLLGLGVAAALIEEVQPVADVPGEQLPAAVTGLPRPAAGRRGAQPGRWETKHIGPAGGQQP